MKKAIIVVGSHYSGKSRIINKFLKPKLGIGSHEHRFTFKGRDGFILSQSFEESSRDVDYVTNKYGNYHYLVLACRPNNEPDSYLDEAIQQLTGFGFLVKTVKVQRTNDDDYHDEKASEIIRKLNA